MVQAIRGAALRGSGIEKILKFTGEANFGDLFHSGRLIGRCDEQAVGLHAVPAAADRPTAASGRTRQVLHSCCGQACWREVVSARQCAWMLGVKPGARFGSMWAARDCSEAKRPDHAHWGLVREGAL